MTSVNAELVRLYWDIGRLIDDRQQREGWGAAVIPRLSAELRNELPEVKGFSERNIKRMLGFHRAYPDPHQIVPQVVAQLPTPAKKLKSGSKEVDQLEAKEEAPEENDSAFEMITPRESVTLKSAPPRFSSPRGGGDRIAPLPWDPSGQVASVAPSPQNTGRPIRTPASCRKGPQR